MLRLRHINGPNAHKQHSRELLSFMIAGPSLSFLPLKLICCYRVNMVKTKHISLWVEWRQSLKDLNVTMLNYSYFNDGLDVDVFIEVNKSITTQSQRVTLFHKTMFTGMHFFWIRWRLLISDLPFADTSTVSDDFHFLHGTKSRKEVPDFVLVHLERTIWAS